MHTVGKLFGAVNRIETLLLLLLYFAKGELIPRYGGGYIQEISPKAEYVSCAKKIDVPRTRYRYKDETINLLSDSFSFPLTFAID